jgi:cobalt/nickel transport system ATP-binding protein
MTDVYTLRDVSFVYPDGRCALDRVTLSIPEGTGLVLLGANGSGKSSLLHILAGLYFPAKGEVLFHGEVLSEERLQRDENFRRRFRTEVGILFQNTDAQLFCPTVREEIAFGPLQIFGAKQALQVTDELLAMFGLEAFADLPPFALSGGEKRKVAFASVLALRPRILLLDEPTANLDAETCDDLFDWLEEFRKRDGGTVISATHDLHSARILGETCAVLSRDHQLKRCGNITEILHDKPFLIEMNLMSRRLQQA